MDKSGDKSILGGCKPSHIEGNCRFILFARMYIFVIHINYLPNFYRLSQEIGSSILLKETKNIYIVNKSGLELIKNTILLVETTQSESFFRHVTLFL